MQILATTLQTGRALGWPRIVPIVLLGFMAMQWTRGHREGHPEEAPNDRRPEGWGFVTPMDKAQKRGR